MRLGSARKSTARLVSVMGGFARSGVFTTAQLFHLGDIIGKSVKDVFVRIMDFVCPDGGSTNEGIARSAYIEALSAMTDWENKRIENLTPHSVRSDKAVLDIFERHDCTKKNGCILHWFSGTQVQLRRAVQMGCFFSINAAMMKSPNGQKLIRLIPGERVLFETDAPFVNEIRSVGQLKIELERIAAYLKSVYGNGITSTIQNKSKSLLAML
jgi:hypothetical protein